MWNNTDYQTGPAVRISEHPPVVFEYIFNRVRGDSAMVREMTSEFSHTEGTRYFIGNGNGLLDPRWYGYAIRPDGELVYVFSEVKGRGAALVLDAIERGATHLDCFDGYLVTLYSRHGFRVVKRVANWTEGGPDVVYMALPGHADKHGARNCDAFGRGCGGYISEETNLCISCGAVAA